MSLKKIFFSFLLLLLSRSHAADPTPWEAQVSANLMGSFQYYSKNWDGDEIGSLSWTTQLNASAQRQLTTLLNNRTALKMAFGQTNYQKSSRNGFSDPVKATDLIDLESLLKFTVNNVISPFTSIRYISQFIDKSVAGEKYYLNPSELTESCGGALNIVKNDNVDLQTRLGGAVRQTFNQHDEIENTNDGGIELVSELNATNHDGWVKLQSQIKIYEALFRSGDPANDKWKHPDINWENTLIVNLTKYIMLNIYTQMLYDKEIDLSAQFKNVTSLGITYLFSTKKPDKTK